MTRTDLKSLPAGPFMDGLLAECFMNYPACLHKGAMGTFVVDRTNNQPIWLGVPAGRLGLTCPRFSTVPAASNDLIKKLAITHTPRVSQVGLRWAACFVPKHQSAWQGLLSLHAVGRLFGWSNWAEGDTLAEAVGRAALLLAAKGLLSRPVDMILANK